MRGAAPRPFALLGDPVDHSVSPALHAAAFRALGVEASYLALSVRSGELEPVMRAFARGGGGNVTVPHKTGAAEVLDVASAAVRRTEACNCFWGDDRGRLVGDNTDVGGFLGAVRAWDEAPALEGADVLLLGAGGAARAVALALLDARCGSLHLLNRTRERAVALARRLDPGGEVVRVLEGQHEVSGPYDLAVNATSLGLDPDDPLPFDPVEAHTAAAFDLVYAPEGTAWVREARRSNIPAVDGREMLVRQAGLSLERWLATEPPLDAMRRALRGALAPRP